MNDPGGWLWLVIDVGFVAALGAALAYGIFRWRRRPKSPTIDRVRDDATKRVFDDRS